MPVKLIAQSLVLTSQVNVGKQSKSYDCKVSYADKLKHNTFENRNIFYDM